MSTAPAINFVIWHARRPLSAEDIRARISAVRGLDDKTGYDEFVRIGQGGHIGLVVWCPTAACDSVLLSAEDDRLTFSTYPLYGFSNLVDIATPSTTIVSATLSAVRADFERLAALSPPFFAARFGDQKIEFMADICGLSRCFEYTSRDGELTVWTRRLSYPTVFCADEARVDPIGNATRALLSYFPNDLTALADVRLVGRATHAELADRPDGVAVRSDDLLARTLGEHAHSPPVERADAEVFLDQYDRHLREYFAMFGTVSELRCGLTGGRDSRLQLAALTALGYLPQARFHTVDAMAADKDLALTVVDALRGEGLKVSHEVLTKAAGVSTDTDQLETLALHTPTSNALLDRLAWKVHFYDAQVMPGMYRSPCRLRTTTPFDRDKVLLNGARGEALRAGAYNRREMERNDPAGAIKRRYRNLGPSRLLDRFDERSLYARSTFEHTHAQMDVVFATAAKHGLEGFRQLDYFSVAAQQSRRIGVGHDFGTCYPLGRVDLLYQSYHMTPRQRLDDVFHRTLIEQLCPPLAALPFAHEVPVPPREGLRDSNRFEPIYAGEFAADLAAILDQPRRWDDTFDPAGVSKLRKSEFSLINTYQADRRLWQLAWRVAIAEHVERLNVYTRGAY